MSAFLIAFALVVPQRDPLPLYVIHDNSDAGLAVQVQLAWQQRPQYREHYDEQMDFVNWHFDLRPIDITDPNVIIHDLPGVPCFRIGRTEWRTFEYERPFYGGGRKSLCVSDGWLWPVLDYEAKLWFWDGASSGDRTKKFAFIEWEWGPYNEGGPGWGWGWNKLPIPPPWMGFVVPPEPNL